MDESTRRPRRWTRRQVLAAGAVGAGALALGAIGSLAALEGGAAPPPTPLPLPAAQRRRFRSRPDLSPPVVQVATSPHGVASGYVFFTPGNGKSPDGPMIVDGSGEPVWIHPATSPSAANLRVTTYRGSPALLWWEGEVNGGYGIGEYVLADRTYREIARVRAGNDAHADLHECQVTPQGTALMTAVNGALAAAPKPNGTPPPSSQIYSPSGGGPDGSSGGTSPSPATDPNAPLWQNVVQEIDIGSGEVLLDWHATDHIEREESYLPLPAPGQVYDFLHANSVDVDSDGHLLLSARHTFAVYKIDRRTGEILWRMGGKRSDFSIADAARFSWQHDARRHPDGSLTVFDDSAAPGHSRGVVLRTDEANRTVTLERQYVHPLALLATSQGSVQVLPNGNVFVGWGAEPYFSEFAPDGTLLFDATFPAAKQSYRSFRFDWLGTPTEMPALAVDPVPGGAVHASVSWNGSTEVASWELLAGERADALRLVATAPRSGFETTIPSATRAAVYVARARDRAGALLASSTSVPVGGSSGPSPTPSPSASPSPS